MIYQLFERDVTADSEFPECLRAACHRAGKENAVIINGIINPAINSLLSRAHHTDKLIISDRGFPYMPGVETIDISLVAGIPRVLDVLRAIRMNFNCAKGVMAAEFREVHTPETLRSYEELLEGVSITWEPHASLKARAPGVVGIIRTGDTTRFGNILLEST
jgi:D-ribose pyranase